MNKPAFEEYFRELIGQAEAEQFFNSIKRKTTARGLRINSLKANRRFVKEWLESQDYKVELSKYSKDGLEISGRGKPLSLKLPYHAGFTYPQDQSSMFAVEILDPQPGEIVLDLTAAPGGKTTHIAQRMKNEGVLVANDMDSRRLKAVHSNLERLGIWNVVVVRMLAHKLSLLYTEKFDRVLLDPSCSGEGLLVTRDGKPGFWSKKSFKRYSAEQVGLLCSAFRMLKPGGRLVYSTCTLNSAEDDGVVERLLKKYPEAEIEVVKVDCEPEQIGELKGVRFWPHKTGTKGFFCIAITKTASLELEAQGNYHSLNTANTKQLQPYTSYLRNHFKCELPDAEYTIRDDHLFIVSKAISEFDLPPFYSLAFPLLKIYKSEQRPTHAGALWLAQHAKKSVIDLERDMVENVFARQPIKNRSDERGLFVAKFGKFPLGVAKLTERVEVLLPRQY